MTENDEDDLRKFLRLYENRRPRDYYPVHDAEIPDMLAVIVEEDTTEESLKPKAARDSVASTDGYFENQSSPSDSDMSNLSENVYETRCARDCARYLDDGLRSCGVRNKSPVRVALSFGSDVCKLSGNDCIKRSLLYANDNSRFKNLPVILSASPSTEVEYPVDEDSTNDGTYSIVDELPSDNEKTYSISDETISTDDERQDVTLRRYSDVLTDDERQDVTVKQYSDSFDESESSRCLKRDNEDVYKYFRRCLDATENIKESISRVHNEKRFEDVVGKIIDNYHNLYSKHLSRMSRPGEADSNYDYGNTTVQQDTDSPARCRKNDFRAPNFVSVSPSYTSNASHESRNGTAEKTESEISGIAESFENGIPGVPELLEKSGRSSRASVNDSFCALFDNLRIDESSEPQLPETLTDIILEPPDMFRSCDGSNEIENTDDRFCVKVDVNDNITVSRCADVGFAEAGLKTAVEANVCPESVAESDFSSVEPSLKAVEDVDVKLELVPESDFSVPSAPQLCLELVPECKFSVYSAPQSCLELIPESNFGVPSAQQSCLELGAGNSCSLRQQSRLELVRDNSYSLPPELRFELVPDSSSSLLSSQQSGEFADSGIRYQKGYLESENRTQDPPTGVLDSSMNVFSDSKEIQCTLDIVVEEPILEPTLSSSDIENVRYIDSETNIESPDLENSQFLDSRCQNLNAFTVSRAGGAEAQRYDSIENSEFIDVKNICDGRKLVGNGTSAVNSRFSNQTRCPGDSSNGEPSAAENTVFINFQNFDFDSPNFENPESNSSNFEDPRESRATESRGKNFILGDVENDELLGCEFASDGEENRRKPMKYAFEEECSLKKDSEKLKNDEFFDVRRPGNVENRLRCDSVLQVEDDTGSENASSRGPSCEAKTSDETEIANRSETDFENADFLDANGATENESDVCGEVVAPAATAGCDEFSQECLSISAENENFDDRFPANETASAVRIDDGKSENYTTELSNGTSITACRYAADGNFENRTRNDSANSSTNTKREIGSRNEITRPDPNQQDLPIDDIVNLISANVEVPENGECAARSDSERSRKPEIPANSRKIKKKVRFQMDEPRAEETCTDDSVAEQRVLIESETTCDETVAHVSDANFHITNTKNMVETCSFVNITKIDADKRVSNLPELILNCFNNFVDSVVDVAQELVNSGHFIPKLGSDEEHVSNITPSSKEVADENISTLKFVENILSLGQSLESDPEVVVYDEKERTFTNTTIIAPDQSDFSENPSSHIPEKFNCLDNRPSEPDAIHLVPANPTESENSDVEYVLALEEIDSIPDNDQKFLEISNEKSNLVSDSVTVQESFRPETCVNHIRNSDSDFDPQVISSASSSDSATCEVSSSDSEVRFHEHSPPVGDTKYDFEFVDVIETEKNLNLEPENQSNIINEQSDLSPVEYVITSGDSPSYPETDATYEEMEIRKSELQSIDLSAVFENYILPAEVCSSHATELSDESEKICNDVSEPEAANSAIMLENKTPSYQVPEEPTIQNSSTPGEGKN